MFGAAPKYIEPLFRPPAEADSLIFQVAYGCPHNSCRFCGMYKRVRYAERSEAEVLKEIKKAGRRYSATRRVFLADGDVMVMPFETLKMCLEQLNESFPMLSRVNVYANGSSIMKKTEDELAALRKLKLNTLYLGLESGDQELLDLVNKDENVAEMISAVNRAQDIGFKCSVMILLGLGGCSRSDRHAALTADAVNQMQPRLLSALRFVAVPGTVMFNDYLPVSEYQAVAELRNMISGFDLSKTVFRANHASNPAPLAGRFPHDQERLLAGLDDLLDSESLDRCGTGALPFFL